MRYNCQIVVFVDVNRAIDDGIEFYETRNGSIVTQGRDGVLPPEYIQDIYSIKQKAVISYQGEEVPIDFIDKHGHEYCGIAKEDSYDDINQAFDQEIRKANCDLWMSNNDLVHVVQAEQTDWSP